MTNWNFAEIRELVASGEADLQTGPFGTQLKASDYVEEGTPVINVRNVGFGNVRNRDLEFLDEEMSHKLSVHRLEKDDIVFARKGAVERHGLITERTHGWIQGSDCLRLRLSTPKLSPKFLSYYFRTRAHQEWMQAVCSFGATMSSLNQDIVGRISYPNPPIEIQKKIVGVLAPYDELISNNLRRIQLLESIARQTYREWFMRMRFPRHRDHAFEKGIPKGWFATPSNKVFDVLSGGTPKTDVARFWDGGIPFFTPRDAPSCTYCLDTEKTLTDVGLESCSSGLFPKDTIFITARGTVGKIALAQRDMAMNQSCYALRQKDQTHEVYFYYLAIWFAVTYIKGVSKSGVFDNIVKDTFKIIPILIPNRELITSFNDAVRPIFEQIEGLLISNTKLAQSRDRLLGRLLSGRLPVDTCEIDTSEACITQDSAQELVHA